MPIGGNAPVVDKLIKKTTMQSESASGRADSVPKVQNQTFQRHVLRNATTNTVKMTFYIKQDLLDRLYNYAYWDRLTVTEAFNTALTDGLKNKNTNPIKK